MSDEPKAGEIWECFCILDRCWAEGEVLAGPFYSADDYEVSTNAKMVSYDNCSITARFPVYRVKNAAGGAGWVQRRHMRRRSDSNKRGSESFQELLRLANKERVI